MAIDKTAIMADIQSVISDDPTTITFGAITYTGRKTMIKQSLRYGDNGMFSGYSFSVMVAGSTALRPGDVASIENTDYRVIDKEIGAVSEKIHFAKKLGVRAAPST